MLLLFRYLNKCLYFISVHQFVFANIANKCYVGLFLIEDIMSSSTLIWLFDIYLTASTSSRGRQTRLRPKKHMLLHYSIKSDRSTITFSFHETSYLAMQSHWDFNI